MYVCMYINPSRKVPFMSVCHITYTLQHLYMYQYILYMYLFMLRINRDVYVHAPEYVEEMNLNIYLANIMRYNPRQWKPLIGWHTIVF